MSGSESWRKESGVKHSEKSRLRPLKCHLAQNCLLTPNIAMAGGIKIISMDNTENNSSWFGYWRRYMNVIGPGSLRAISKAETSVAVLSYSQ